MKRTWVIGAALAAIAAPAFGQSGAVGQVGASAPLLGLQITGRDPTDKAATFHFDANGNLLVSGGTGGGGGGGGAVTIANGQDVAEGNTGDAAYADATGAGVGTLTGLNKGQYVTLRGIRADLAGLFRAGQAVSITLPAATTAALTWSVSATTTVGPWTPQLGRDIWASKTSTDAATIAVTATVTGSCADSLPLTSAGASYTRGSFSGVASKFTEDLGQETRATAQYCVTITPGSGATSTGSLAQ